MTPPVRSPLLDYLIAAVSTVVGLLATQGLISNQWEKTISGIAAVAIPLAYIAAMAIYRAAHVHASALRAAATTVTPAVAAATSTTSAAAASDVPR